MIRWYQSINAPYFACFICHIGVQSSTKLKGFEAEVPKHWKHCIFGWLWHFSACEAELRGLISWHVELSLTLENLSLHIAQMPMAQNKQMFGLTKWTPQTFLFASSDLRLQEDRPCMCQLFRCCCVSWLETKPDVADQKGGTEGGKSWQITFPTIFQRCHQKPLMNDLKYFKESQKYKFSISHTSLLIPIWPGYPSLLATFRWEGLWNDRFSRAPRHCVQTKIDWKFSIRSLGDP